MTIELHTWATPNGRKAFIMLEELGVSYETHPIHISKDEQFAPAFLKISPNNKIPAILDPDGPGGEPVSVFESGAILIYLAEKYGQFLPQEPRQRIATLEWLMFQMGGVGPMFGQFGHFNRASEQMPYAIERYDNESRRLCGVIDKRIADIATFPWVASRKSQVTEFGDFPNLDRWFDTIAARAAVERSMAISLS